MEGLRERESVLMGYSLHQRPLTDVNSPGSSKPFRNSGVDFHDVFGGPPRRFSMQEQARPGLGGVSDEDDDEDDDKPVFGDDVASRRRLPSADFFEDIFGGGSSVHSTPMRHSRDYSFPSSPGSRALSPLPPRSDQTFGTSSFPSQFSLPEKSSKSLEVPKFRSSSSNAAIPHSLSSTSLSRFSSEPTQPISLFTGDEESPKSDPSEADSKKETKSTKKSATSNNSGHFHFSIYKWRSKGVPLDIPLRGKASRSKHVAQSQPSNKTTPLDESDESFFPEKQASEVFKDEPAKEFVPSREETQKPELEKSVPSLFYDETEKGMDGIANSSPSPEVVSYKTTKKQDRKNSFSKSSKANSNTAKGVQFSESNNTNNGRSKVKGKVKDFVKIFNHEPLPKAQQDGPRMYFRSKSCKWSEKHSFEEEEEKENEEKSNNNTPEKVEEQKFQTNSNPKASINNEDLEQSAKVHASVQDRSTPGSDSVSDGSNKVTAEETDDSFHDNFQVKDITQDENNEQLLESTNNHEFTDIDAKIREWTRGKEGNIRSLLSTLQYVLWAESGWRTVPLVDIIEGSAVKRAYQRAMLCLLHQIRLQQKNASSQQKYMAEKVFDILQEAWNYFNTLGAI